MKALDWQWKAEKRALSFELSPRNAIPNWKRWLDIFCVLLTLPIWLPMCVLIGIAIKLVSPGPILFKQERVGLRETRFQCFKFRTMKVNAETGTHQGHVKELITSGRPMIKLDVAGDKRLVPGGAALRSLGLDELPQLVNVLRGEMSLVGPRPSLPYECECYRPRDRRRFGSLPGLTGLWQVNGKNQTTFEQMIDWDIHYVENKSFLLDLSIICRTPKAVLGQVLTNRRLRKGRGERNVRQHDGIGRVQK